VIATCDLVLNSTSGTALHPNILFSEILLQSVKSKI